MANGIFKLGLADVGKGLVVAVLTAVAMYLLSVLNAPGFDFATINWAEIARLALSSGLGYLVKNFFTDNQGNILAIGSN